MDDEEHESKYLGSQALFERIKSLRKLGGFELVRTKNPRIHDTYYDTRPPLLTLNNALYRLRVIDGKYKGTFKEPNLSGLDGSIHTCIEVERDIPESSVQAFSAHALHCVPYLALRAYMARKRIEGQLEALLFVDNNREALIFENTREHAQIEVDLDQPVFHLPEPDRRRSKSFFIEAEFKGQYTPERYELFRRFDTALRHECHLEPCYFNKVQWALMLFSLNIASPR